MWRTKDGRILTLPRFSVRRMLRRLRRSELRALAGGRGAPELAKPLAGLAGTARRTGQVTNPRCGCRFPIYVGKWKGMTYRILTHPLPQAGRSAILFVRLLPANGIQGEIGGPDSRELEAIFAWEAESGGGPHREGGARVPIPPGERP